MTAAIPTCRHFGSCGGCTALDVPMPVQIARKRDFVRNLLARTLRGVVVEHEEPPVARLFARTKILYPVQPDPEKRLRAGIYARQSHAIVEIEECAIQDPALTEFAKRVLAVLRASTIEPYDEATQKGFLRAFHVRLAPGTGEMLLGLVTKGGVFPLAGELARELAAAATGLKEADDGPVKLVGIVRNINDTSGNALLGPRTVPLLGRDHIVDRAGKLTFRISFQSFAQTHRAADKLLYEQATAMLGDVEGARIVDGYGGIGAFGIRLAVLGARSVDIVESAKSSCADAEYNARKNHLPYVRVVATPFAEFRTQERCDVLLVDPPRAGLLPEGARAALLLRAPRILHVACSPVALAKDLQRLIEGGYKVVRCRLVDLFPFTEHVEVLTLLERARRSPGADS